MPHTTILADVPASQKLDLIICLGSQLNDAGEPTWPLQARVETAVKVFQHHPECYLLLTGGKSYHLKDAPVSEAEAMRKYLLANFQVDRTRLFLENESQSTIEQLCMIKNELIIPEGYHAVALVSDEFHVRRAGFMFSQIMGNACRLFAVGAPMNLSGKYREALRQLEDGYYDLTVSTYKKFTPGDDKGILEADRGYRTAMRQHVADGGDILQPIKRPEKKR